MAENPKQSTATKTKVLNKQTHEESRSLHLPFTSFEDPSVGRFTRAYAPIFHVSCVGVEETHHRGCARRINIFADSKQSQRKQKTKASCKHNQAQIGEGSVQETQGGAV